MPIASTPEDVAMRPEGKGQHPSSEKEPVRGKNREQDEELSGQEEQERARPAAAVEANSEGRPERSAEAVKSEDGAKSMRSG
jgi:hypothetical protein